MPSIPEHVRRIIIRSYQTGKTSTYEETAKHHDVSRATVNRLLRKAREGKDIKPEPENGGRRRKIDLVWLKSYMEQHPDARLIDGVEALKEEKNVTVSQTTFWYALQSIKWSHKKNSSSIRTRTR